MAREILALSVYSTHAKRAVYGGVVSDQHVVHNQSGAQKTSGVQKSPISSLRLPRGYKDVRCPDTTVLPPFDHWLCSLHCCMVW